MIRIEIDRELCIGYGACADAAPKSLRLAADGKVEPRADALDDEDVLEAEAVCPMGAIAAYAVEPRAA